MSKIRNDILTAIAASVIAVGAAVNMAQASESKEKEAKELKLFSQAKISLIEAVKIAEQKLDGKALEAELDDESNTVQFDIEILKDGKIHDVIVEGKTGKVMKVSLNDESGESSDNESE